MNGASLAIAQFAGGMVTGLLSLWLKDWGEVRLRRRRLRATVREYLMERLEAARMVSGTRTAAKRIRDDGVWLQVTSHDPLDRLIDELAVLQPKVVKTIVNLKSILIAYQRVTLAAQALIDTAWNNRATGTVSTPVLVAGVERRLFEIARQALRANLASADLLKSLGFEEDAVRLRADSAAGQLVLDEWLKELPTA